MMASLRENLAEAFWFEAWGNYQKQVFSKAQEITIATCNAP
jgi:hypothetical protein